MAEVSIATVNAAIAALVGTPQVDYKIGDKSVKAGQKLTQLLAVRKALIEHPEADIDLIAFDLDINEFGTDNTQRIP